MSAGLPSFLLGPFPIATGAPFLTSILGGTTQSVVEPTLTRNVQFGNNTLNAGANAANSFDMTVLESKDFYNALLSPVDLPTLYFFVRQGYEPELLFWLFADAVRETVGGKTLEYRNEPLERCEIVPPVGQRCFRDLVGVAVAAGLSVEIKTIVTQERSGGGGGERASSGGQGGPNLGSGSTGGTTSNGRNGLTTTIFGRLCFDPVLARRNNRDYPPEIKEQLFGSVENFRPYCGTWKEKPAVDRNGATDTLTFDVQGTEYGKLHYEIITRSTFGIYQFLGRILRERLVNEVKLVNRIEAREDNRILAVRAGVNTGGCFVDLVFNAEYYCVPKDGAEQTKQIFSLLAQLLALKTQTGDLAITPVVRVAP